MLEPTEIEETMMVDLYNKYYTAPWWPEDLIYEVVNGIPNWLNSAEPRYSWEAYALITWALQREVMRLYHSSRITIDEFIAPLSGCPIIRITTKDNSEREPTLFLALTAILLAKEKNVVSERTPE